MPRILNGFFGLAFDSEKRLLLTQRHQPQDPQVHLKWQVPGGGQEFGEHPHETLAREMKEELGIDAITILDPRPFVSHSVWGADDDAVHVNVFTYIISIGTSVPFVNDEETAAFQWFSLEEALKLDTLPNAKTTFREAYQRYEELVGQHK